MKKLSISVVWKLFVIHILHRYITNFSTQSFLRHWREFFICCCFFTDQ
jgi:hypothetical protein